MCRLVLTKTKPLIMGHHLMCGNYMILRLVPSDKLRPKDYFWTSPSNDKKSESGTCGIENEQDKKTQAR